VSTIKVIDVIQRVEDVIQDENVRWPRLELQNWINEAYLQIVLLRPDSNAVSGTFVCAGGTKQNLNDGGDAAVFGSALRLLDVVRNLEATSDKKVIRHIVRSVLDDQRPSWHAEEGTLNIQNFTFDPRRPKEFYVFPPALATTEIEVVYADAPKAHTRTEAELDPTDAANQTVDIVTAPEAFIKLDDIYLSSIIDWVLYRSYSKDAEYAANAERAMAHNQAFFNGIGAKTQTDMGTAPSRVPEGPDQARRING
jgi:hypothetical protein